MCPSNFHSSGSVRLAEAEIVAPSSNHSDGLPAHAPLMIAVSAAIAQGSRTRALGCAVAAGSASSATEFSTIDTDMIAFNFRCTGTASTAE